MQSWEKNLKVLFVAGKIGVTNGAFHSLLTTTIELKNMGVEPIILLSHHGIVEENFKSRGIKCIVIPYEGCTVPADHPSKIKGLVKSVINYYAEIRISGIVKDEKIDIIHINVGSTAIGAKTACKKEIPLVWHLREFLEEDVNLTFINKEKTTSLMKNANQLIAISNAISEFFSSEYRFKNITTIYNGISYKNILPVKKINAYNKITITLVGRIVPGKGQIEAVRALRIVRQLGLTQVSLRIVGNVGDSNYYNQISEYIKNNNLEDSVIIEDHKENLQPIWQVTDIGLICSVREGFGRVTAEFMLNGIPVIGADTGATPELLMNNRGYLYRYGNDEDLAKKIIYAIQNVDITYEYAQNAQKYASKEFTSYNCARKICDVYSHVLR